MGSYAYVEAGGTQETPLSSSQLCGEPKTVQKYLRSHEKRDRTMKSDE